MFIDFKAYSPRLFLLILLLFYGCTNNKTTSEKSNLKVHTEDTKGLKDYYKDYFPVGVSVSPKSLEEPEAELVLKQFNSLTAENVMKMGPIHPEENRYYWDDADKIVDFAQENGMLLRGHTLVWHQQYPEWIFTDHAGDTVTKDVLLKRLEDHITTVVSRFKGKIYAWDVVNEAIEDKDNFYRNSPWIRICGEDYIIKAFEYAHAADPDALLFYNDYSAVFPGKRERIIRLIKNLQNAHVPIHGIGIQGHWSIHEPSENILTEALHQYSKLGLHIQITELDISVYPGESLRRDKKPDEADVFTAELEQKQIEQYSMVFKVFRNYKKYISGVTFWNVSDRKSWLDNFPVKGRKNYPLLFDENLKPKKAYYEVVNF
jgi:endo-1,4-beta-xylanase